MPNHITNRLSIEGEVADKKRAYSTLIGNNGYFDFNKIVPMPKELGIESGGIVDNLALALKGKVDKFGRYCSPEETFNEIKKMLTPKGYANSLKQAIQHNKNLELYGSANWYEWCPENWGTKWNAYDQVLPISLRYPKNRIARLGKKNVNKPLGVYLHRIAKKRIHSLFEQNPESSPEIIFDTAWSTPEPVISALSRRFPSLVIKVRFADEDIGSNCGEYHYQNDQRIFTHKAPRWNEMNEETKKEWRKFAVLTKDPNAVCPEHLLKSWGMDSDFNYIEDEE